MKYLEYLNATWEEFRAAINEKNALMLIPIGCLEEHGPHLPLNCDGIIAERICQTVAKLNDVILGPTILFGVCRTTQGFPGTIEVRIDTLRALIYDVVYSFASQGLRNIVLFSWHGGTTHATILREACIDVIEKLREENIFPKAMNMEQYESLPHIYLLSGVRLLDGKLEDKILSIVETPIHHACELETSLMLYLDSKTVKTSKLKDLKEFPNVPDNRIYARGNIWLKQGLMGDASKSTAEKGKKIFDIFLEALTERIKEYKG